ncbi:hypothetical protein ACWIUD_07240 [Helicobacter sp. 23-1044]
MDFWRFRFCDSQEIAESKNGLPRFAFASLAMTKYSQKFPCESQNLNSQNLHYRLPRKFLRIFSQ